MKFSTKREQIARNKVFMCKHISMPAEEVCTEVVTGWICFLNMTRAGDQSCSTLSSCLKGGKLMVGGIQYFNPNPERTIRSQYITHISQAVHSSTCYPLCVYFSQSFHMGSCIAVFLTPQASHCGRSPLQLLLSTVQPQQLCWEANLTCHNSSTCHRCQNWATSMKCIWARFRTTFAVNSASDLFFPHCYPPSHLLPSPKEIDNFCRRESKEGRFLLQHQFRSEFWLTWPHHLTQHDSSILSQCHTSQLCEHSMSPTPDVPVPCGLHHCYTTKQADHMATLRQ